MFTATVRRCATHCQHQTPLRIKSEVVIGTFRTAAATNDRTLPISTSFSLSSSLRLQYVSILSIAVALCSPYCVLCPLHKHTAAEHYSSPCPVQQAHSVSTFRTVIHTSWYETTGQDMTWHDMTWYHMMIWYITWYDTIWYELEMIWYDTIYHMIWYMWQMQFPQSCD